MNGLWYVIQTMSGQEEVVVEAIKKIVPDSCYQDCFYIKRECAKKIAEDLYQVHIIPQFPGYVFVVTDSPEQLFYELRQMPQLTKLLREDGPHFLSVTKEEQEFLELIQDCEKENIKESHVIRRSLVRLDEDEKIVSANGAVGMCFEKIVKQRIRKRYVLIEQDIWKQKRRILLGIKLISDVEVE